MSAEGKFGTFDQDTSMPVRAQEDKTPRVLACVLCQQRKIRCDRKFPCKTCKKANVQCIPATSAPRRRRRVFPERELLERVRRYESLLNQNNVDFEPLRSNPDAEQGGAPEPAGSENGDAMTVDADDTLEPKREKLSSRDHFWRGVSQVQDDTESESENENGERLSNPRNVWPDFSLTSDHLLFGGRSAAVDLSSLHPSPVQIFRLWQVYLDNVDPLLKLTHTPTLQRQIIEYAENPSGAGSSFEALLFAVCCTAVSSLDDTGCFAHFGSFKSDLLTRYNFGCQQALLNCRFVRTTSRDVLTAYVLYLLSIWPRAHPRSLSPMFAIAVRIAERMNICHEAVYATFPALEGELNRRLWWSIKQFDTRITELADYRPANLGSSWDCRIPLNISDADLRLEMAQPAVPRTTPSESMFVVVRSMLNDFNRTNTITFSFNSLESKHVMSCSEPAALESELDALERRLEDEYLRHCDTDNSLHYMTLWTAKCHMARYRLVASFLRHSSASQEDETSDDRHVALLRAMEHLACNTRLMTSPLTRGFTWFTGMHFPFSAYIHILKHLQNQPLSPRADGVWEMMAQDYDSRFSEIAPGDGRLFDRLSKCVLDAWKEIDAKLRHAEKSYPEPRLVSDIKLKSQKRNAAKSATTGTPMMEGAQMALGGNFDSANQSSGFNAPEQYRAPMSGMDMFADYDLLQQDSQLSGGAYPVNLPTDLASLNWTD